MYIAPQHTMANYSMTQNHSMEREIHDVGEDGGGTGSTPIGTTKNKPNIAIDLTDAINVRLNNVEQGQFSDKNVNIITNRSANQSDGSVHKKKSIKRKQKRTKY